MKPDERLDPDNLSRREWLLIRALEQGAGLFVAAEAVASTALAHPEWDMDERRSWAEWEADS